MTQESAGKITTYNWNSIPKRVAREGIIQRGFRGSKTLISYAELHPNMTPMPHSHEAEQIFMILKGRVKLHVGDQVFNMEEGSIVRIPPYVEHWSEPPNPDDGVAINMDIFSSIRPDQYDLLTYQTEKFETK